MAGTNPFSRLFYQSHDCWPLIALRRGECRVWCGADKKKGTPWPGSPSGRSLNAETIGKATQKPCPSLEVRFPALVSRRDYALVSWRQTERRATSHLKTRILRPRQTGPYPTVKRKAISAEVRSQSLNLAASKAAIFLFGIRHGRSWASCIARHVWTARRVQADGGKIWRRFDCGHVSVFEGPRPCKKKAPALVPSVVRSYVRPCRWRISRRPRWFPRTTSQSA